MKSRGLCQAVIMLMAIGCTKPEEVVLGKDPLNQIAEQGEVFKRLPEDERKLLVAFLGAAEVGKALGAEFPSATGRTVGEVLIDARAWKKRIEEAKIEQEKRDAEAEALRARVEEERKATAERISASVVVAIIRTKVLPENYDAGRYSRMLLIDYAIENKSAKPIVQIKGTITFKDPTGDVVGQIPTEILQTIKPGQVLKTDTGRGWQLNKFNNGPVEQIADRDSSTMRASFQPTALAFEDGEVIRVPDGT